MFDRLSFQQIIFSIILTSLAGVVLLTLYHGYSTYQRLLEDRRATLQAAVESMYAIASGFHAKAQKGEITQEQAQQAAAAAIEQARYGGQDGRSEYFYIWTLDGVGVMHPIRPEWRGQHMADKIKDGLGRHPIKDIADALRASSDGRAFVDTHFPRPGQTEPVPKLQYAMAFKPWNWMIGSGLYLDDLAAAARAEIAQAALLGGLLLSVIIIVSLLAGRSIRQQIGGDPAEAQRCMSAIAQGRLDVDLGMPPKGSLLDSLAQMSASLRRLVAQVRASTDSIATASSEIAQGNQDLSHRTEQAASSLQQTASSMEQLTGTVKHSADAARQANQLASNASSVAQRGGQVVSQVVSTMEDINSASKKIADIIGVIDGIAFQTNILA
uniref:methyl-accepting chemotaxis protein n=1 Tax=Caldimonas manganoxidans TaxID=196015 RepID=UPI00035FEB1E